MPPRPEEQTKEQRKQAYHDFISCADVINLLRSTKGELARGEPDALSVLVVQAQNYGVPFTEASELVEAVLRESGRLFPPGSEPHDAIRCFREQRRVNRATPTHHEKREWAIKLGLFIPRNIRLQFEQWVAVTGIKVVVRPPFTDSKIRRRTVLYDYPPLPGEVYESPYIVCDEAHDFYIVGEDESVAFVQLITNDDDERERDPLLVVFRGVGADPSSDEDNVPAMQCFSFMDAVVETACNGERRGVRPTEPGMMAQLGWNAGPRHARVWGLAKSFVRKSLSTDVKAQRDRDAVAVLSMAWGLIRTHMPCEAVDALESVLDDVGMPRLATRDVSEGEGYEFDLDGRQFCFPFAPRAPPEGYMIQAYSAKAHKDGIEERIPKAWALHTSVRDMIQAPAAHAPSIPSIVTRSKARKGTTKPKPQPLRPACCGGSFVDCELRVVVRPAARTITEFDPRRIHGTTRPFNRLTRACAFTSSRFIWQAFMDAQKGLGVEGGLSGTGADTE